MPLSWLNNSLQMNICIHIHKTDVHTHMHINLYVLHTHVHTYYVYLAYIRHTTYIYSYVPLTLKYNIHMYNTWYIKKWTYTYVLCIMTPTPTPTRHTYYTNEYTSNYA